jgi:hypothetical protein
MEQDTTTTRQEPNAQLAAASRHGPLAAFQLPFDGSQLARGTTSSI